jgi:hypothetical protein
MISAMKQSAQRVSDSLARFDIASVNVEDLQKGLEENVRAAHAIVAELKRDIQSALLSSFMKSGVKVDSGRLVRAILSSSVVLVNGRIRIAFPEGAPNDVMTYGASINYGRVCDGGQGLGEKAKRTLKKAVFKGGKLSKRQMRRFEKGYSGNFVNANTGFVEKKIWKPVKIEGCKVVPPKPFYYIQPAHQAAIREKFYKLFDIWLRRKFRARAS